MATAFVRSPPAASRWSSTCSDLTAFEHPEAAPPQRVLAAGKLGVEPHRIGLQGHGIIPHRIGLPLQVTRITGPRPGPLIHSSTAPLPTVPPPKMLTANRNAR